MYIRCFGIFFFLVSLSLRELCSGTPLNKFIKNFEPVYYNRDELTSRHHIVKRSPRKNLQLQFSAFDKLFELQLHQDRAVFTADAVIETGTGTPIEFDQSRVYIGSLKGQINTAVHGVITEEGLFDGNIITPENEYIIESAARYFQQDGSGDTAKSVDFQSIIYRISDIEFPSNLPMHCGFKYGPGIALKRMRAKYGGWLRRPKRYNTQRTCCGLFLQGDHTFTQYHGSVISAVEALVLLIQSMNIMYPVVDFDDDGGADNITFAVQRMKMYTAESLGDPDYPLGGDLSDSSEYLDLFSMMGNYDDYCLAYVFTDREFDEGVLGLAWKASHLSISGGICQNRVYFAGTLQNLNTGLVTLRNDGLHLPAVVMSFTLEHEIGHSFGASHDILTSDVCSPGEEEGGVYTMNPYAVDGSQPNNRRFSPCSKEEMDSIIKAFGISSDGCFIEHPLSVCGNGIVEGDEECDCGFTHDCVDDCCYPMDSGGMSDGTPCTLKPGAVCSPETNPCCSKECSFYTESDDMLCREDSACVDAAYCQDDGLCSSPVFKPDGTMCSADMICFDGECSSSLCEVYGFERCQCSLESELCHLCCTVDGTCISSYNIDNMADAKVQPGRPCNGFKGYCDSDLRCQEVEPKIELLPIVIEEGSSLSSWLPGHWWVIILIVLATAGVIVVIGYKVMQRPGQVIPEEAGPDSSLYAQNA